MVVLYIDHLCCRKEAILAEVSVGSLNEIMKLQIKRIKIKKAENGLEDQCSDCQSPPAKHETNWM